jgi:hypothetical protein
VLLPEIALCGYIEEARCLAACVGRWIARRCFALSGAWVPSIAWGAQVQIPVSCPDFAGGRCAIHAAWLRLVHDDRAGRRALGEEHANKAVRINGRR